MHSHVGIEVATSEPLAAGRAQYLLPGLVPREVLLEVLLGGHASATDPADELGLVVPVLHVGLERVKVLAEVPADVADDRRRVAVVLLHVVVQGLLDLELLAADVAGEIVAVGVQPYVVVLQVPLLLLLYSHTLQSYTCRRWILSTWETKYRRSLNVLGQSAHLCLCFFKCSARLPLFKNLRRQWSHSKRVVSVLFFGCRSRSSVSDNLAPLSALFCSSPATSKLSLSIQSAYSAAELKHESGLYSSLRGSRILKQKINGSCYDLAVNVHGASLIG